MVNLQTTRFDLPVTIEKLKINKKGYLSAIGDDGSEYEQTIWTREGLYAIFEKIAFQEDI